MNYKNAKNKNNIYYYPNDSFYTITIKLNFLAKNDNDKAPIYDLLCRYLAITNQNYNTEDDIDQKSQSLYDLLLSFNNSFYGNQKLFSVNVDMISPNVISDDYSKEAFDFICDMIKKPDFTKQEELDQVKRNLLSDKSLNLSDNDYYTNQLYNQIVLPSDNRKYDSSTDIDYITKMVQSVTLEDLEKEYTDLLNNFYNGFIFGDLSEEQFNDFVDTISLTSKKQDITFQGNIATVEGDIELERDTEQSYIFVTYDTDHLNISQGRILHNILNTGFDGRCHQVLREKYGLVYHSHADILNDFNKIVVSAQLDSNKKEQFLIGLDEMIDELNNPELLDQFIEAAKNKYFANEYTTDENQDLLIISINNYLLNRYDGLDRNEVNDAMKEITSEELMPKTKTLKRKNVFLVRGGENE